MVAENVIFKEYINNQKQQNFFFALGDAFFYYTTDGYLFISIYFFSISYLFIPYFIIQLACYKHKVNAPKFILLIYCYLSI